MKASIFGMKLSVHLDLFLLNQIEKQVKLKLQYVQKHYQNYSF